mmetsp:Transcript_16301/g.13120  ORF Transcript_16301/g.13120 Transcript_16301/m.13120 type:complete len:85 (+) Transcript_16301:283-537(+)
MLPPRQRTGRTRLEPNLHKTPARPISNLRFFWWMFLRPPVLRCLWRESREIPMAAKALYCYLCRLCLEPKWLRTRSLRNGMTVT